MSTNTLNRFRNKYSAFNELGRELCHDSYELIDAIVEKYWTGEDPNELRLIGEITCSCITTEIAERVLRRAMTMRKEFAQLKN